MHYNQQWEIAIFTPSRISLKKKKIFWIVLMQHNTDVVQWLGLSRLSKICGKFAPNFKTFVLLLFRRTLSGKIKYSGGVLTGVVLLLVHNGSVPASPCQEWGRSKSPPPSSSSPSLGLGDTDPSYNINKKTNKHLFWLLHHDIFLEREVKCLHH